MLWYEMERDYRTEQKDDNVNLHSGWSKALDEVDYYVDTLPHKMTSKSNLTYIILYPIPQKTN